LSYLLDTNVVSELARARPEPRVIAWFSQVKDEALCLSVLTLGELRRGVEALPLGAKRERLRAWLETELPAWFGPRRSLGPTPRRRTQDPARHRRPDRRDRTPFRPAAGHAKRR
jgi:PIN domain